MAAGTTETEVSAEMLAPLVADLGARLARAELALAELAGAVFSAGLTGSIRRARLSHIEDLLAERISVEHAVQLVGLPLGPERPAA